eukprot:gene4255-20450_t
MAKQMELFCESIMRGYHAYINVRKVGIGEIMFCEIEGDNEDDDNVIAIKTKDNAIVGHVPEELLSLFYKFLEKHGEVEGDCISCRFNKDARKGVELPMDYRFIGNLTFLEALQNDLQNIKKSLFSKDTEERLKIEICDIRHSLYVYSRDFCNEFY